MQNANILETKPFAKKTEERKTPKFIPLLFRSRVPDAELLR